MPPRGSALPASPTPASRRLSPAYRVLTTAGELLEIDNPSKLPTPDRIEEMEEPYVTSSIYVRTEFMTSIYKLAQEKRGEHKSLEYIGKRSEFSANYRGFVRRYVDLEGLNGFDQHAGIGFKRVMSRRLTLFVRDSFVDSPTTDEVDLNGRMP